MRLPLPGPAAVIGGATAAAEAIETALGLVPRAAEAMTRVEALLDRGDALLDRFDTIADRSEQAVERADQAMIRADKTNDRAGKLLGTAELTTRDASRVADGAAGLIDRLDTMMQAWEPQLRKLAPKVERFATALSESEVDAAIQLVDRMPLVLDHMENDVLPMLQTLDRVGPDLHEVLEIVEDLRRVITGLPGIGLLRKRGEDEPPAVAGSVHEGS